MTDVCVFFLKPGHTVFRVDSLLTGVQINAVRMFGMYTWDNYVTSQCQRCILKEHQATTIIKVLTSQIFYL